MLKQATLYWCIFRCFVQYFIGDKEGAEQRDQIMSWLLYRKRGSCSKGCKQLFIGVSSAALCSTLSVTKRALNREQIMSGCKDAKTSNREQIMSGCKDAQTSNSLLVYLPLLCAVLYRWQRGSWTESRSWVAVRMLKQATLYWCIFCCFAQYFIGDKDGAEQRADHEWL